MTISDAELSAMYGRGLHPDTAVRVFDELRRVKAKLNESRATNDELLIRAERAEAQEGHWHRAFDSALDERDQLRTRLTETEVLAERWNAEAVEFAERLAEVEADLSRTALRMNDQERRAEAAEAAESRLAAVLALCDRIDADDPRTIKAVHTSRVRAAAAGDDRAAPAETPEQTSLPARVRESGGVVPAAPPSDEPGPSAFHGFWSCEHCGGLDGAHRPTCRRAARHLRALRHDRGIRYRRAGPPPATPAEVPWQLRGSEDIERAGSPTPPAEESP